MGTRLSGEPLSEELEKAVTAAALEGDGMDALNLVTILRAFAREIQDFCEHGCEYAQAAEYKSALLAFQERCKALLDAAADAAGGMALAYHCASKGFNDEVLLHLGVHEARLRKVLSAYRSSESGRGAESGAEKENKG